MDTPTNSQQALAVLAQQRLGQLPAVFRNRLGQGKLNDDMAAGITSGFAIISFRGKAWRVKYRGEEKVLLNPDGRTPRYSIDAVIVKSSPHISKVWYEAGYVEGSTAPPDCWSVDGKKPDPASPKLQNATCAGCRWNAWGSTRSTAGSGKGKDCADSKRLAIVPLDDIDNEIHGGPMLLRVPPASLGDVLAYATSLEQIGFPYYAVGTSISFDVAAEYPKLQFGPLRALTEEEALKIDAMRNGALVERIISAAVDEVKTDGVDTTHVAPVVPLVPRHDPPPVTLPSTFPSTIAATPPAPVTPQGSVGATQDMRAQMRAMGLSEAQIVAALGPEPKPEPAPPPADPRIDKWKAMGLTDQQIEAMLAVENKPAPAPQHHQDRGEVATPADLAPKRRGPKPKPKPEPAPPTGNGHQQPTPPPANVVEDPPMEQALAPKAEAAGDLPAGFEEMLEGLVGTATKQ